MFKKIINFIFGSARRPVNSGFLVVQNKEVFVANNETKYDMVRRACIDLNQAGYKRFTSAMVYTYLDGLVEIDNVYKYVNKLVKKGCIFKVHSLDSDKIHYSIYF